MRILTACSAMLCCGVAVAAYNPYMTGAAQSNQTTFTDSNPASGGNSSITQLLGELIQDTGKLDADVKNNSSILLQQWNTAQMARKAAVAQWLPSSLSFLWQSGGYQYTADFDQQHTQALQQMLTAIFPKDCPVGKTTSSTCLQALQNNGFVMALNPQSSSLTAQLQREQSGGTSGAQTSQGASGLAQQSLPNSMSKGVMGYDNQLVAYAIGQVMATNTGANGASSINAQLEKAVMQPLSQQKADDTNKTWFQALSTASTPQLLRMVAVQMAINNYIAYQRYRLEQTHQMLTINNTGAIVNLQEAIKQLQQSNTQGNTRLVNAVYQLVQTLRQQHSDKL